MHLTRDEWMIVSRALEDRHNEMTRGFLMAKEADAAMKLKKRVDEHVDELYQQRNSHAS
jgi:hypothetical protein